MKQGGQAVTCPICNEQVRTFKASYGVALVVHPSKNQKVGDIECEGTGTLIDSGKNESATGVKNK